MTYDWAYLCNDPARLQLTLKFLPRDRPFVGLRHFKVCYASHLDGPDAEENFRLQLECYAPDWLRWSFCDLTVQGQHLPPSLAGYWSNGKSRWSLGMKLMLPFAFQPPYLYTDDDVIVPRDPQDLMGNSFGSKGCFRFAGRKQDIAQQLFEAFFDRPIEVGGERHTDCYDRHALDAGVWFHKYPDSWIDQLWRFSQMPYLKSLTTRNLELRCLDQRFLTMFGLKHGWDQLTIHNGFAPPKQIRRGYFDKVRFFHYKSQSKLQWMALLHDYLGV